MVVKNRMTDLAPPPLEQLRGELVLWLLEVEAQLAHVAQVLKDGRQEPAGSQLGSRLVRALDGAGPARAVALKLSLAGQALREAVGVTTPTVGVSVFSVGSFHAACERQ